MVVGSILPDTLFFKSLNISGSQALSLSLYQAHSLSISVYIFYFLSLCLNLLEGENYSVPWCPVDVDGEVVEAGHRGRELARLQAHALAQVHVQLQPEYIHRLMQVGKVKWRHPCSQKPNNYVALLNNKTSDICPLEELSKFNKGGKNLFTFLSFVKG